MFPPDREHNKRCDQKGANGTRNVGVGTGGNGKVVERETLR